MNNNVVYRAAKALVAGGVTALRFNFRGVGASTGSYAEGIGEEEDVRAAVDFLRAQAPGLPIWIAGFSFGARVGLTVGARSDDVAKLFGIGLALDMFDYGFLSSCRQAEGDRAGVARTNTARATRSKRRCAG